MSHAHKRLFIAVNLPADERRAAFAAAAPLRAVAAPVKWVAEENLHLTMKFLGEVDGGSAQPIGDALASAVRSVKPFDVSLGGPGAFPDSAHPRIFWIGVEHHPALELLANDVERAVGPLGFEPELRPFQPHITIGRARKDASAGSLRAVTEGFDAIDYAGVIQVESVDLMESRPAGGGSEYTVLSRAMLGGGA